MAALDEETRASILATVKNLKPGESVDVSNLLLRSFGFRDYNGAVFSPADNVLEKIIGSSYSLGYQENFHKDSTTFYRLKESLENTPYWSYVSPDRRQHYERYGLMLWRHKEKAVSPPTESLAAAVELISPDGHEPNTSTEGSRLQRAERIIAEIWQTLYGQNLQVTNWHRNGEPEPLDNVFDSSDWQLEPAQPKPKRFSECYEQMKKLGPTGWDNEADVEKAIDKLRGNQ